MPQILFTLAEPRELVLMVLCASITAYLASLRDKTRDLVFLIGAFSCWTMHFLFSVSRETFYPVPEWIVVAEMCIGLSGLVLFIGFAYSFGKLPYANECRWSLALATTAVTVCSFVLITQTLTGRLPNWCMGSGTSVVLFLWAEIVLIRKWIRAENLEEARPFRGFTLTFLLSIVAVILYFLRDLGVLSTVVASALCSLLYLSTLVGFTLVYINHAANPTTFRVKITGATLFTVLALLIVTWTILVPEVLQVSSPARLVEVKNLVNSSYSTVVSNPTAGNSQILQKMVLRFNYCILASAFFVLTSFPAFFRLSLVNPLNALLDGVGRVNAGVRALQVPVIFHDEIGRLTNSFNQMSHSLKAAEDDLKSYAESLELKVQERTAELARKNEENERLLLNILPASIAERLKRGEAIIADACSETTVLFADIVGFTDLSAHIPATELTQLLSGLVSDFDRLAREHGVEKIKTIGDGYLAVAGLPESRTDHAQAAVSFALDMLDAASRHRTPEGKPVQLRIGINSGPVTAGVIGTHKFAYDLWGDTVNTASRMESQGKPGRIQVTEATYALVKNQYAFETQGQIHVKGKGPMPTYFLAANAGNEMDAGESCICEAA